MTTLFRFTPILIIKLIGGYVKIISFVEYNRTVNSKN